MALCRWLAHHRRGRLIYAPVAKRFNSDSTKYGKYILVEIDCRHRVTRIIGVVFEFDDFAWFQLDIASARAIGLRRVVLVVERWL